MVSTESRPYTAMTRPRETAREPPVLAQIRQRERRVPPQVQPLAPPLARAPRQVPQRERQAPPLVGQREPQARPPRVLRAPPRVRRELPVLPLALPLALPLVGKRSRQVGLRGCQARARAR